MECETQTTVNQSSAGSRPGDNFVSPEFNLVLVAAMTLMLRRTTVIIGYLVDVVAGGLLLYGTLVRKQILYESRWTSNFCTASEETVSNFFVYSLVSWVASAIIEVKSCRFLIYKIQLGGYDVQKLNKKQLFGLALSLIASANACWVMLQFSSAVHKSFEKLTDDPWLFLYYLMAAAAKNSRVFLQGLVFTSWVPGGFLQGRSRKKQMAMGRMGITNSFMLLQAVFLSTFPSDASVSTINTISLIVDFGYRMTLCVWFLRNGRCYVNTILLAFFRIAHNIGLRTIRDLNQVVAETDLNFAYRILDDPNRPAPEFEAYQNVLHRTLDLECAAAEADPNIEHRMLEDLKCAAAEADPNVEYGIPEAPNHATSESRTPEDLKHATIGAVPNIVYGSPEDPNCAPAEADPKIIDGTTENPNCAAAEADPKIVYGTPEDPNRAVAEADLKIVFGTTEDPNRAAAEAGPKIVYGTPEDPNRAVAEADLEIVFGTTEDPNRAAAEADPKIVYGTPEDPNFATAEADPNVISKTFENLNHSAAVAQHPRAEVEPPMDSFEISVEESSSNLNFPAGNALCLTSHSLFVLSPRDGDFHLECQKLIEAHNNPYHHHLELIQRFPDNFDLHTQSVHLFHDTSPQQESNTSFASPFEKFEPS